MIQKLKFQTMDAIMCLMMNYVQWKLRHKATTKPLLEAYLQASAPLNRNQFFAVGPMEEISEHVDKIIWKSPNQGMHPESNRAQALFFPNSQDDANAPTLIMLHALMSASDGGYQKIAKQMNNQGWNVLFPHLPFHYSRTPRGYAPGALAITTDFVRNGETLRQAVQEMRQLMAWSRTRGSKKIGIVGTSYGAWVAALLLSVETIDHAVLLQPIIDIGYTTFESPLSTVMGRVLKARGITAEHLQRHAHLTAPFHGKPLCRPEAVTVIGATYDNVSPPRYLKNFCQHWEGSYYHEVEQGHFGFAAMKQALSIMEKWN